MTTFNSRSRCERKQLNRHFRFSWDSTLCPTSAVWGSFYHKSRAGLPHPHWDPKSPILQWLPAFFFFFFSFADWSFREKLGQFSVELVLKALPLQTCSETKSAPWALSAEGNALGLLVMFASPTPSSTGCFLMPGHSCLDANRHLLLLLLLLLCS